MKIRQETTVVLRPDDMMDLDVSVIHWGKLSQPPYNRGFVRHGVPRAVSSIPQELKPDYVDHAAPYETPGCPQLLLWGTRNSMQNLLLPLYHVRRTPRLLCRVDEPWEASTYDALVRFRDGHYVIAQVRFSMASGDSELHCLEIRGPDGKWVCRNDVEWAVVGQGILENGMVPSWAKIVGQTSDLRHLYRLRWEEHQNCPRDAEIHSELMSLFMQNLTTTAEVRGAVIDTAASQYGLAIEDGYLHSSLGVDDVGRLYLITRHGSICDIGRAQRELGAHSAILLDNGGSNGLGLKTPGETNINFFGNGTYFRPRGHAVFVATLRRRFVEPPFDVGTPDIDRIVNPQVHYGSTLITDVREYVATHSARSVTISFRDHCGVSQTELPLHRSDELNAHLVATHINNRAMLHGTQAVALDASQQFVQMVKAAFAQRFELRDRAAIT